MKVQWKIAARFSNTKRVVAHMHRDDQSALNRWSNLRVMHGVIGDGKSFIFDDWDRFWGFVAASGVEVSEIKRVEEKMPLEQHYDAHVFGAHHLQELKRKNVVVLCQYHERSKEQISNYFEITGEKISSYQVVGAKRIYAVSADLHMQLLLSGMSASFELPAFKMQTRESIKAPDSVSDRDLNFVRGDVWYGTKLTSRWL